MKKYIVILMLLVGSIAAKAQTEKVQIKTSAICGMCKNTIERDMAFEKGVKTADLDLETMVLTVEYNSKKTDADKIRKRISEVGYNADSVKRDQKAYDALDPCCKDGAHQDDH
jgi:mercuric ion binding protein